MPAPVLGKIADLTWLSPSAESLAALAQSSANLVWDRVRHDPGCVLLIARHAGDQADFAALRSALSNPSLLRTACDLLDQPAFLGADSPVAARLYRTSLRLAQLAEFLAQHVSNCDSQLAWMGGLLAPLGWFGAAALVPDRVEACLASPDLKSNACELQRQHWGIEHAAIARRLSHAWRLPPWLRALTGNLGLPADVASTLGADITLFRVVQLAARLLDQQEDGLGLSAGDPADNLLRRLGLSVEVAESALARCVIDVLPALSPPAHVPHLAEVLRSAQENRRRAADDAQAQLHPEIDALHAAFELQTSGSQAKLLEQKLHAMAELAAGAGHEINNPLAVISGQAQFLMTREADPARVKSLQVIVEQAKRIHQLLVELMHFARPPLPRKTLVPVAGLVREAILALQGFADYKKVELQYAEPSAAWHIHADAGQVQTILKNLLRNAIEAADGWARVQVERPTPNLVRFTVEDSGPGPSPSAREHLFDPFFSGRSAGRGRGLGLSTAWKFARLNDGDLRFHEGTPTRFVLEFPAANMEPASNGHHTNGASNGSHTPTPALLSGEGRLSWD